MQAQGFYDFTVKDIDGRDFDLNQLKGKKVMVVNVASECGFTHQYAGLQEIFSTYRNQDFVVIGFPANDFGRQEPGSNNEIKQFCTKNFGVEFPMMAKISVKGEDMHPLYQWLTEKELNGKMDSKLKWNFQKYLINERGELVNVIKHSTEPTDEEIINWITQ